MIDLSFQFLKKGTLKLFSVTWFLKFQANTKEKSIGSSFRIDQSSKGMVFVWLFLDLVSVRIPHFKVKKVEIFSAPELKRHKRIVPYICTASSPA